MKAFLALLETDLKLTLRDKSAAFFNYLFPLIFFFLFGQLMNASQGSAILRVVSMVTLFGILGNGLFGAGMRAVSDREANVLRRYKVAPITPLPLLLASVVTGMLLYLPALALMLTLAHFVYGMQVPSNLVSLVLFVCVASAAFRALGLIIAAVVNNTQQSNLLIQPVFMVMMMLGGGMFPLSFLPEWLQIATQFVPATYVNNGVSGILQQGESIAQNWHAVLALLITAAVALFIATKIFRWEKEEKLRPSAKLWVFAVLLPFVFLGAYQAWSRQDLAKAKILERDLRRGRSWLVQDARIFIGDGKVIESGSVLIRKGKIEKIFEGPAPDAKSLDAEPVEAAGKTLLPGLIDVHAHLGATGGFYDDWSKFDPKKAVERALKAYLYCGVTAVRSAADTVDTMLDVRRPFATGEKLGAELLLCGPIFTAEDGHGTQFAKFLPEPMRPAHNDQFVRIPKSAEEGRRQVDDLAAKGVDAIKGVLESGSAGMPFKRMDVTILAAVAEQAQAKSLPIAVHTGSSQDVADAVALGATSIEHGSFADDIPETTFAEMKAKGIAYNPTLSVAEGYTNFARGDTELLKRSLVQQVAPKGLIEGTQKAATGEQFAGAREGIKHHPISLEQGSRNLVRAWQAGVTLVTGSDAGNFLIFHGPTVQREIELWIAAGIPPEVALQAATANAAKLLRIDARVGTIAEGKEATLLLVDGNPLQDVRALSAISTVFMKGERVVRPELLKE
jgi:imidazolonepropionase-like amidohydrolase/ABC-type multidrug transport system permease subunit